MKETLNDTIYQVDQEQPPKKLSVRDFAARIKAKYPDYKSVSDDELVQKIISKYPDYKEQVDFIEKKSLSKNGSFVSTNGASKPSEPDFTISRNELAEGQQSVSDNTRSVSAMNTIISDDEKIYHEERKKAREDYAKKIKDATPKAIENTAKKALKNRGLNPNNSALLSKEKAKLISKVEYGDATVGFGENGEPGLTDHPDSWNSFYSHMMGDINNRKNAREFNTEDLNKKVEIAEKLRQQKPSEYLAVKPTRLASVTAELGGATPSLGLFGAGVLAGGLLEAAAPATGFLSNLALKPVMSFAFEEGNGANIKGMQGTLDRYYSIMDKNPEMDKEQAMKQASSTEYIDRAAGIIETALFSKVGGTAVTGKTVTGKFLKGMHRSGVNLARTTTGIEGLRGIGHQISGDGKDADEIIKDMANMFGSSYVFGGALHGLMGMISGGLNKSNKLLRSALKYDVIKEMTPEQVKATLDENVRNGAITPEQAEKAETELTQFSKAVDKVPENLSDEAKASVAGLILKRENLKKGAESKDESAKDLHTQEVESINNQIKEIYRTGKPLEHEQNPVTGETFKKPTFDDVQKQRVEELADKIAKGKRIEDAEDVQTQANFPEELEKQLQRLVKKENSGNKDKEKPTTDISDNVEKFNKQNEKETTELPITEEKGSIADEGVNKNSEDAKENSTGLKTIFKDMLGNAGLGMMEADIKNNGISIVKGIDKASPQQVDKIKSNFEELKKLYPEKNLQLIEENNSITIKPKPVQVGEVSDVSPSSKGNEDGGTKSEAANTGDANKIRVGLSNEGSDFYISTLSEGAAISFKQKIELTKEEKLELAEIDADMELDGNSVEIVQRRQDLTEKIIQRTGLSDKVTAGGKQKSTPLPTVEQVNKTENKPTKVNQEKVKVTLPDESKPTTEPPIEPPKENGTVIHVEEPEMSFKKDNLVRARNRVGIDEFVDEGKTTHLQELTKAQRTIEQWIEYGTYGENMADIQERAARGQISNQEKFIFAKHLADLDATVNAIKDVSSKEYDKALSEYNKALNAADAARSEAGRQLGMIPKNRGTAQSLADVMVDMMGDKGVDVLTPEQKVLAEKRYSEVKTALDKEAALRIEAENKIKELEAENAILKAKKENAKNPSQKKNKTAEDYTKEREELRKSIKDKWNKAGKDILSSDIPYRKQLAAITPDVARLIKSYVEQNTKIALSEVRKLLKKDLEDDGIKISDEDVRGLIAGKFSEKKQTKNEISAQIYDLRKEEKLLLELDAIESGKEPTTENGKQKKNERLADLRKKIDELKKQNGIGKYSDESRFLKAVKQRIASNKKTQAELQGKIDNGDYSEKPQDQSILENTQFQQKYPKLYKEYQQSITAKDKTAFEYEQKRINDKIKNYSWVEKFGHGALVALHTSKGTVAIFDQSGLLVQLIQTTLSHPIETANNVLPALRDLVTNKWFDGKMAKLKTSKYWDLFEKMDLPLYDTHSHDINFRNDLLGGDKNLLNKDMVIGGKKFSIGKAFERSTATLFNNIRVKLAIDKIDQLHTEGKTWENAPEEFKAAGRVIAEFTGHGKVHKAFTNENWNLLIWSSKMMASTFNTLGLGDVVRPVSTAKEIGKSLEGTKVGNLLGIKNVRIDPKASKGFYSNLTPQQRKFAAKEMGRFILSGATILGAAYLKGKLFDDDEKKTTIDATPLSTDFGSIKSGDKTVNVYGRYSAAVGGLAQMIMGIRYLGGDKKDVLGDKFGDKTAGGVGFGKFVRGKMTPSAGMGYDYFLNNRKNYFTKEEITPLNAAKQVAVPLAWQDLVKDIQREDPALKTALWTIFKIYGGNVRDSRDFKKRISGTGVMPKMTEFKQPKIPSLP